MTPLAYCQTAIRLGSSRGLAYRIWRNQYQRDYPREQFDKVWKAARAAEELFPLPYMRELDEDE